MQMGFYFDQSKCVMCYSCGMACIFQHSLPSEVIWRRVKWADSGKPSAFLSISCLHCLEPICLKACPVDAITKREEDGIVLVDQNRCRGRDHCGESSFAPLTTIEEKKSPCKISCPAGLDIQGYIALIAKGYFKEALSLIRRKIPLPGVVGRVCHHPCEAVCKRGDVDEPVAIMALKRFVTDYITNEVPAPTPRTKKAKVAIIGSGPAGLAAAYHLVRKGFGATIFEALPVVGGMLVIGIPEYRLPRTVLQKDIEYIKGIGVEIRTNTRLGDSLTFADLTQQGYAAVFLAIGAHRSQRLYIPGEDLEGVEYGLSFLSKVNLGRGVEVGKKAAVIGGGNGAVDAARTALRLGAKEVTIVYRRSVEEIPAFKGNVEEAYKEGANFQFLAAPVRILGRGGRVAKVECVRMELLDGLDETGRRKVMPIAGSEFIIDVDKLILAVGEVTDMSGLPKELMIDEWGTIAVDPVTLATNLPGVFAGGDVVGGPATVIDAIAAGQQAAISIERYLSGQDLKQGRFKEQINPADINIEVSATLIKQGRQTMPSIPISQGVLTFSETALGFTKEMAIAEANRCMHCAGMTCKEVCPYNIPQFGVEPYSKMSKCDFCLDRLERRQRPICVNACPFEALDCGLLDELTSTYGDSTEGLGFTYSEEVNPSFIIRSAKGT